MNDDTLIVELQQIFSKLVIGSPILRLYTGNILIRTDEHIYNCQIVDGTVTKHELAEGVGYDVMKED